MDTQVTFLCNVVFIVLMLPETAMLAAIGVFQDGNQVKCITCPTNCQACTHIDGENVCTSCRDGYWLSGSSCQPCSNNCVTCFNVSSCRTCKPEFHSPNSACLLPCSTNCLGDVCDENTGHCSGCPSDRYGYYCDLDCALCKHEHCDLRKCTEGCKNGYWQYQKDDYYECKLCMDNCSLCDSFLICNVCNDEAYLSEYVDTRNYCSLCPSSCEKCSTFTSCSACKVGYFGGACEYQCSNSIPNCVMCDWDGVSFLTITCRQCANGWTLQDNKCLVSPQQCPINCERCTGDNMCELCKKGWTGELCDKSCSDISHCVACQEADVSIVCNVCDEGYSVMDGECSTITTQLTSTTSEPPPTTMKTSKSSINSEPPLSEYKTPMTQPESTSFQTSTLVAGIFIGIGISMSAIFMIGLVWFIRRRKRLQTSSTSRENDPYYENSFAADESHLTTINPDGPNQENIQQMRAIEENDREPVDQHQTPVDGESVSTSTNMDQHDYTSLNVRHGEHIYKDLTAL